jgi:hypothetical protein
VTAADWLTTVPVGEPDEDGERAQVPVALTRMTPGQIDRWAAAVNNASPEQIAEAQIRSLQHLLDERERELAALREAAEALVTDLESPGGDQIWMCDRCPSVAMVHAEGGVCDAHADGREISRDFSYAAPLRALRALLGRMP